MKKHLLLLILFTFIGCASISYKPVTQPDQRILLGGFSFLPPNGENWEMTTDPIEVNGNSEWGRVTSKSKVFKKNIMGPEQKPDEVEILQAVINKYEMVMMKFDHNDFLMDFSQASVKTLDKRGYKLLESSSSNEKINGMECVRVKGEAEGGRKLSNSEASAVILYYQGYTCVDPRQSDHLIALMVQQSVVKGQTPTNVQNEFDHFLNSLQVQ